MSPLDCALALVTGWAVGVSLTAALSLSLRRAPATPGSALWHLHEAAVAAVVPPLSWATGAYVALGIGTADIRADLAIAVANSLSAKSRAGRL